MGRPGNLAHLLKNFVGLGKKFLRRLLLGDGSSGAEQHQSERDCHLTRQHSRISQCKLAAEGFGTVRM